MIIRLVVHAPTAAALLRARRNVANLRAAEPDAEIELVVNAEAVRVALEQRDSETDDLLVLCANSLSRTGLAAPADLRAVAAAIQHIARRQAEGWTYFRA